MIKWLKYTTCKNLFTELKTDSLTANEMWNFWKALPNNPFLNEEEVAKTTINEFWDFVSVGKDSNGERIYQKRFPKFVRLFFFEIFFSMMILKSMLFPITPNVV